ncbi:type I restriction-modification enzyme R subunit C-terminal domain-containing protein [Alterinioella nitratireducens]|uniref:type I restriction-modification enzyme R subunit C-terminal domain-containing protein n=1 Tax=Alterinioella nitratireducens TaxID=2735915 RepID=UPI0040592BDA
MNWGNVLRHDRGTVQEHFAEFIADGKTADQIEFVGMVIEHLCRNGVVDPGLLYESPFSDDFPDGPDGLFDQGSVERFVTRVRMINLSAMPEPSGETDAV